MQKKESVNIFFPAAQNIFYVNNQVFVFKTFVNIKRSRIQLLTFWITKINFFYSSYNVVVTFDNPIEHSLLYWYHYALKHCLFVCVQYCYIYIMWKIENDINSKNRES